MRYEKEVRLRLIGDKTECQKYILRGRTILGEVFDRDVSIGGNEQAWRRVILPEGVQITVYWNNWLPVIEIDVTPLESPPLLEPALYEFRMAWVPEGIVMTPVTEEFPEGYGGLPTRTAKFEEGNTPEDDVQAGEVINPATEIDPDQVYGTLQASPYGTEEGLYRQVLLNRYPNNKYLDRRDYIAGLDVSYTERIVEPNPRHRDNYTTPYTYEGVSRCTSWQRLYNPVPKDNDPAGVQAAIDFWASEEASQTYGQVPGAYRLVSTGATVVATLERPQFADGSYSQALITENETEQWYCHRPEELLYEVPSFEGTFQYTNEVREGVGEPPMFRQIRGQGNWARTNVIEVIRSGYQYHDLEDPDIFRPGMQFSQDRGFMVAGDLIAADNLIMSGGAGIGDVDSFDFGVSLAQVWENSPYHYANMTNTVWGDGATQHAWSAEGTITDSLSTGPLPDPVSGLETCQGFSKDLEWLEVTETQFVGTHGTVGWDSPSNIYSRDISVISAALTFGQHNFIVDYEYDYDAGLWNPDYLGIIGAAIYMVDGVTETEAETTYKQSRFRIVTAYRTDTQLPTATLTIKVMTAPVATGNVAGGGVDTEGKVWEEESSYTFPLSDGWLPFPEGSVRFHPDGDRFVMSLLKQTDSYDECLSFAANNFGETLATPNPRFTVELNHIEYDANATDISPAVDDRWEITPEPVPEVAVEAIGYGGNKNSYTRSVKGTVNMFSDYVFNDVLQEYEIGFVAASFDQKVEQWVRDEGDNTNSQSYLYNVCELIFPSGKTVPYQQSYMEDYETLPPEGAFLNRMIELGMPGEHTLGSFSRVIHYLNVADEDVVYTHIGWETELTEVFRNSDMPWEYGTFKHHGAWYAEADLGIPDIDPALDTRQVERLYTVSEDEVWRYEGLYTAGVFGPTKVSDNRPQRHNFTSYTGAVIGTHCHPSTAQKVYSQDCSPFQATFYDLIIDGATLDNPYGTGTKVAPILLQGPHGRAHVSERYSGFAYTLKYDGKDIDNLQNSPPIANYKVSVAPGLCTTPAVRGAYNTYPYDLDPDAYNSMQTGNIAPALSFHTDSLCDVVRYKDRIVVRLETKVTPVVPVAREAVRRGLPETTSYLDLYADLVEMYNATFLVPDEAKVAIYTNFDLDEAVGLDNVTDIYPLGRV